MEQALEHVKSNITNQTCPCYTQTSMTTSSPLESGAVPALGAAVGLLVVALIVTTTGWVWTCWILKKRGVMDINSEQIE